MKKLKKEKKPKKKAKALPPEVVLLENVCDLLLENAYTMIDFLHEISICSECLGRREH